jgi:hypothetical protein
MHHRIKTLTYGWIYFSYQRAGDVFHSMKLIERECDICQHARQIFYAGQVLTA